MDLGDNLETYQVGAHFEALDEGALLVPLDPRYTQVGINLVSVQVWLLEDAVLSCPLQHYPFRRFPTADSNGNHCGHGQSTTTSN